MTDPERNTDFHETDCPCDVCLEMADVHNAAMGDEDD